MIILASGSPRRQELLRLITSDFAVESADIDETVRSSIDLEKYPEYLALKKARRVTEKNHYTDIVLGCDTGVFIDDTMLGKPTDEANAREMLKMLSGRTHKVITGCAILHGNDSASFSQETLVEFYSLTDKEIDEYISTGEPMDKAGAYGIQGYGAALVRKIDGDFYNVVGLPVAKLKRKLHAFTEI